MQKILFLILLNSFLLSDIFNVPSDQYPTIQSGIDVAQDGDTVLVDQGIYYENLKITRSITLASHAIFDDLTDWNAFSEIFWQWEVTNDNINNTIIDGGTATDDFGSTILIYTEEEACITPEIIGFTIQNGKGTYVERPISSPETPDEDRLYQRLGGGILFDISNPKIQYNKFLNNGSNNIHDGGSMYLTTIDEDWDYNQTPTNYFDLSNSAIRCDIEEFDLTNNFYNGNDALYGNSFANTGFENTFDMSESIFDVANCNIEEVSPVWVYVEPEATLDLEEIESNLCAFTASDVYVNSNIDQECIDDGCGTFNNPFKTITWTLQMIMPSENNPVTIHLANGAYNPETGEVFPIVLIDYVNIEGESQDLTVLDAQQTGRVIEIINVDNSIVQQFTATGGIAIYGNFDETNGGGIYIKNSNLTLKNINVIENVARNGGGIHMNESGPILYHLNVSNNMATEDDCSVGGGLHVQFNSYPTIINSIFSFNQTSNRGGGIYARFDTELWIYKSTIVNNELTGNGGAQTNCNNGHQGLEGGGIFMESGEISSTILWNNFPYEIYASSFNEFIWIDHSNIQGGPNGIQGGFVSEWDNINDAPVFVDADNQNFNLSSISPCIDMGSFIPLYFPEVNDYYGNAPDIGAFEFSYDIGDINTDEIINILDLVLLVNLILSPSEYYPFSDINGDSIINVLDIIVLINIILDNT